MRILVAFNRSAHVKRAIDIVGALIALALFAPVMLAAAACVFLTLGRPVFFRQQRTGKSGAVFSLIKFRTMLEGSHLPDTVRLTPAGTLLRSLSVDELPQLWNVLRGDMSLVGPRPLLHEYLRHFTSAQRRRLDTKPGITGWAQVNGRNSLNWEEKLSLDAWYVDHATNFLDLLILLRTPYQVLCRSGINQPGNATASRFCPTVLSGREAL